MALGTIISADGSATAFDYQSTQSTFQANNSLTINGPNIIIEFAVGAENVDLEAEYINYLNKVSRNPGAALNSFMSQRIVSVAATNILTLNYNFTFEAAATLEDACAASPSATGRMNTDTLVIGSMLFQFVSVDGITIWDPINAGTYAVKYGIEQYFVTVVEGGYVSAFEICPLALTYDGIAGIVGAGISCSTPNSMTFGVLNPSPPPFPPFYSQLFILDGGEYRAATISDLEFNSIVKLEFNFQTLTPTPGQSYATGAFDFGGIVIVENNSNPCP